MKTYPAILGITLITLSIAALISACTGERIRLRPRLNKVFEYKGTKYKWIQHTNSDHEGGPTDCHCDEQATSVSWIKATVDCTEFSKSPCE